MHGDLHQTLSEPLTQPYSMTQRVSIILSTVVLSNILSVAALSVLLPTHILFVNVDAVVAMSILTARKSAVGEGPGKISSMH